jgi:lambda repressor-like predicted transcriptional regulator
MPMSPDEIKKALAEKGLTMAAVGRRGRPPVSRVTVRRVIHNPAESARVRGLIARALGRTEDEVFGGGGQQDESAA